MALEKFYLPASKTSNKENNMQNELTKPHAKAISIIDQYARALDSMSQPQRNTITQFSADQSKAQADAMRAAIRTLETADAEIAALRKDKKDALEALENLMAWQVRHVTKWHNPAYDDAARVVKAVKHNESKS
jgi:hypothetical protein